MRSWINLFEGGTTPTVLYHGTSFRALMHIISQNTLNGSEDDNGGSGTFCSDRMEVSRKYISDAAYNGPDGGILVLDAVKISSSGWDIQPYEYHSGDDGTEYLIDTLYTPLRPLSDYLGAILMSTDILQQAKSEFNTDLFCLFDENAWNDQQEYLDAVDAVFQYPFKFI